MGHEKFTTKTINQYQLSTNHYGGENITKMGRRWACKTDVSLKTRREPQLKLGNRDATRGTVVFAAYLFQWRSLHKREPGESELQLFSKLTTTDKFSGTVLQTNGKRIRVTPIWLRMYTVIVRTQKQAYVNFHSVEKGSTRHQSPAPRKPILTKP